MFTKERDGGSMEKVVEKIVISPEGIDIISNVNGVNNVTQIGLEPQAEEVKEILEKYNLIDVKFYPIDMNIIRALAETKEQLVDYLESSRRATNSKQKVDIPESVPQITYDLKELRNSFEHFDDENVRKSKQIELYNQAKQTQNVFKSTRGKVEVKIGMIDRAYFAVQELLQNRNREKVKMLNPGVVEESRNLRREIYNSKYTEATNEVSKRYTEAQNVKKENEVIKENDEVMEK